MNNRETPWWEEDEDEKKDLLNLEGLDRNDFENMIGAGSMPPKSPEGDEKDGREPDVWDSETF